MVFEIQPENFTVFSLYECFQKQKPQTILAHFHGFRVEILQENLEDLTTWITEKTRAKDFVLCNTFILWEIFSFPFSFVNFLLFHSMDFFSVNLSLR